MEEKNKEVKKEKKTTSVEKAKVEKKTEVKKQETPKTENKEQFKKVETKKEEPKKVKTNKKETKKSKDIKGKKWVTPTIIALVVIAIIAVLTFMIVTSTDPKKTVEGLFTDLKAGDFEKAQEFINVNEEDTTELLDENLNEETKTLFFDKLSWKVIKVTENGNEASVEVEITNKNYKTIITNMMQKALKAAFSGKEVTEQESQNYLTEELKNEQVEMTTVTKTINVVKVDKKWKVVQNDELVDSLLPGLQEAINSLG
ncbi:MAG: DUF4878 domain-containing protein [Clostridia bacterium]|nr:DUF4878 domain-containing protein [Clostridia bacterium]